MTLKFEEQDDFPIIFEYKNWIITIDDCGGNCPVQAEGRMSFGPLVSLELYFRSRGISWTVEVTTTEQRHDPLLFFKGQWSDPTEQYAAGWMGQRTALQIIKRCCEAFIDFHGLSKGNGGYLQQEEDEHIFLSFSPHRGDASNGQTCPEAGDSSEAG